MAKFEMGYSPYGPPGRPRELHGHQPYPCQMYKVKRADTGGGVVVVHSAPAGSDVEQRNYESRGYYNGLAAAAEALGRSEQDAAELAANRVFTEQRMSDAAKAEAAAADDATPDHLASIPETPVNRQRGKDKVPGKGDLV